MVSSLRVEEHDGVAVVTIDRPPVNATDVETLQELTAALDAARAATAIVLTGAGACSRPARISGACWRAAGITSRRG